MAKLTRADIVRIVGNDPKLIQGFEAVQTAAIDSVGALQAQVDATDGINAATVLTLSKNNAFDNERVLALKGLVFSDGGPGGEFVIALPNDLTFAPANYRVRLNLIADTTLTLPATGKVATTIDPGPYASDAEAASNGVQIGERYRSSGAMTTGYVVYRQS